MGTSQRACGHGFREAGYHEGRQARDAVAHLDGPAAGGTPRQLTFSERGENAPQWSPDGRSLAFLSARGTGTDAKTQIWILPMDGGEAYQLTTSKENVTGFEWSKDGSRIAFLAVDTLPKTDEAKTARRDDPQVFEENFRLSHAWVIDVATKRATEVAHGNLTVSGAPSWSPDGTRLAFQAAPTTMIRDSRSTSTSSPSRTSH
jgi:Tol biopolymer transport system component